MVDCGCDKLVDFSELVKMLGCIKHLSGWGLEISGACVEVEMIWFKFTGLGGMGWGFEVRKLLAGESQSREQECLWGTGHEQRRWHIWMMD